MKKSLLLSVIIFIVVSFCTNDLSAQSFFLRQKSGTWLAGEVNFLNVSNDYKHYSGLNTALNLKLKTTEKFYLIAELPIVHGSTDYMHYDNKSETAIGNPFIGFQVFTKIKGLSFISGVRLPAADKEKSIAYFPSYYSDLEKFTAFFSEVVGINILSSYEFDISNRFFGSLSFGPSLMIPKKNEYNDTELYANYSFALGFNNELFKISSGITGIMIISESDLNFDERTLHHFVLSGAVNLGKLLPGITARIPMDEFSVQGFILGLSLGLRLGD